MAVYVLKDGFYTYFWRRIKLTSAKSFVGGSLAEWRLTLKVL